MLPEHEGPPDPYALVELTRDLRPPDYAAAFVRLAVAGSPLDEPITVSAVFRPPWLEAVAAEPGVAHTSIRAGPRPLRRRRSLDLRMRAVVLASRRSPRWSR